MAACDVTNFFEKVRANPDAVARLSGCANTDEFVDRAVLLGQDLGFAVARDDILGALRAMQPSGEVLSDDELDHVQAAGAWEAFFKGPAAVL